MWSDRLVGTTQIGNSVIEFYASVSSTVPGSDTRRLGNRYWCSTYFPSGLCWTSSHSPTFFLFYQVELFLFAAFHSNYSLNKAKGMCWKHRPKQSNNTWLLSQCLDNHSRLISSKDVAYTLGIYPFASIAMVWAISSPFIFSILDSLICQRWRQETAPFGWNLLSGSIENEDGRLLLFRLWLSSRPRCWRCR